MWQSWPPWERLPKRSQQDHPKSDFKCKRGENEEGRPHPSETSGCSTNIPRYGSPSLKIFQKLSFLNPNLLTWWSGPKNIARAKIDGESSWALLDSWLDHHCSDPRVWWGSFFGCWSFGWPDRWHPGYQWFWKSIFLALGLCHHKSADRRSLGL